MNHIGHIDHIEENLLFSKFRFRCHRLGDLMTNLPGLTAAEQKKFNLLSEREKAFKKGKDKDLTPKMKEDLKELTEKKNREDSLPAGAKSYLDDVFDEIYWKRKRILSNKYLDKGLIVENDVLGLHSGIDKAYYDKNEERFYNDYLEGMPDNLDDEAVRDAKANFDLETFRKAHLSTTYLWQIKGYLWLTARKRGELMYGLVNNPHHQILNAMNTAFYQMGRKEDDDEETLAVKRQIERNMIFDAQKFRAKYPNYVFENAVLDFDIPEIFRAKKFQITLDVNDILNMKTRVTLARIYLCQKEIEARRLDGTLIEKKSSS